MVYWCCCCCCCHWCGWCECMCTCTRADNLWSTYVHMVNIYKLHYDVWRTIHYCRENVKKYYMNPMNFRFFILFQSKNYIVSIFFTFWHQLMPILFTHLLTHMCNNYVYVRPNCIQFDTKNEFNECLNIFKNKIIKIPMDLHLSQ